MSDLKQLRLTCKQLQPLVNEQLFRTVAIHITVNSIKKSVDMLQFLATRTTVLQDARELVLCSLSPAHDPQYYGPSYVRVGDEWVLEQEPAIPAEAQSATKQVAGCLRDALRSFRCLTTIRWFPVQRDSKEVQTAVIEALASLPTLKNLHLDITNWKAPLPVDNLKDLEEISISGACSNDETMDNIGRMIARSPELRSLKVPHYRNYGPSLGKARSLYQLLEYCDPVVSLRLRHLSLHCALVRLDHITLPHLRNLTSLELIGVYDPFNAETCFGYRRSQDSTEAMLEAQKVGSSTEDIWKAFATAGARLEELKHDSAPRSLLKYLSSYSGLKSLDITPTHFDSASLSDAAATEFFSTSLKSHAQTLETLKISPPFEGKWCFNSFNSTLLSRCTKLKHLHISITSSKLATYSEDAGACDVDDSKQSTLHDLVNLAAESMLRLETLTVDPANLESLREELCGNPAMSHFARATRKMAENMYHFRAQPPIKRLPTLFVGKKKVFTEDKNSDGEGLRYYDQNPTIDEYEDW
ncbi:unnamed protein product [Cyclocybe aegerita]|uniref:F-box domain-containing protein n=1 Tax=Cyclocybe aegerita TaxID=1973307 RepID=A0A8S0XZ82_CYCAE|nr:unnamed protein product [Cyclocybe aegerita]